MRIPPGDEMRISYLPSWSVELLARGDSAYPCTVTAGGANACTILKAALATSRLDEIPNHRTRTDEQIARIRLVYVSSRSALYEHVSVTGLTDVPGPGAAAEYNTPLI